MRPNEPSSSSGNSLPVRLRLRLQGAVQGVGFRPFVYRLATELGLRGWVSNTVEGLKLEVEGARPVLESFRGRLERERPEHSVIQSLEAEWLEAVGHAGFEILASEAAGARRALVLPDLATCGECLREILDPGNRRFGYPFTNCTHCGPRFSIVERLPYDRANTSMRIFPMCSACQKEYHDPCDRRFHAQPNACPDCGPQLALWNSDGRVLCSGRAALQACGDALRAGRILAVKGLGGFHLMTAATAEASVRRLRQLKHRAEKPFALMFPNLETVRAVCAVSELEAVLLRSAASPIVLLHRRADPVSQVLRPAASVAPGNPWLGVMLPYTPLHHLLLQSVAFPVVATSGNLAEEPICIDEHEALQRLGGMADLFLVHNRPIVRHADDSIVRVVDGRELILRRARGYAPLPLTLPKGAVRGQEKPTTVSGTESVPTVLAVGAHLKNAVALAVGSDAFISQHIGDLETSQAYAAFERVITDFEQFYEAKPAVVACDAHPDYLSTQFAQRSGLATVSVQHHFAHVLSCAIENGLAPEEVLGVAWDGTGLGADGTIWGGEFLIPTHEGFERFAHLRTFPLPGGDQAAKEPRRAALGLLFAIFGSAAFARKDLASVRAFSPAELRVLGRLLETGPHCPMTSSAGRLFDAVASLVGLRQRVDFEGQAAMQLEWLLEDAVRPQERSGTGKAYPFPVVSPNAVVPGGRTPLVLDWEPMLHAILHDFGKGLPAREISLRFHEALIAALVEVARFSGKRQVVLSGGCFQNRWLLEAAVQRLRAEGFEAYTHRWVPPNDGGIALGQVAAARRVL